MEPVFDSQSTFAETDGGLRYSARWQKTLLVAIPFGALAYISGWFLEVPSNQSTIFDLVSYPIMAILLILLEVILAASKRALRFVVLSIIAGASLFFLAKLLVLLFLAPTTVEIQPQLTETFYWVPVIYLLSYILPEVRAGRYLAATFTGLTLLLSLIYGLPNALQDENWGVIYALVQLNLANTVLLALTSAFISFKEDYTQSQTRIETTERFAYTDTLTELPNRHSLQEKLDATLARAAQQGSEVAVLFIDIDGFKLVNDTLGHEAGDELLKQLALRLRSVVRRDDFIARISGDEFILIVEGAEAVQTARFIAQKLQAALVLPFNVSGQALNLTASIGISLFPDDGSDGVTLLKHADVAMYRVKRSGKNGIQHYRKETDAALERQRELERDLRAAVQEGQLHLVYQPMYNLGSGKLTKLEALVRWHHPRLGHIPPNDFIPLAEGNGDIVSLGTWVLNEACRQAKTWQHAGAEVFKVTVNVSPFQFSQTGFFNTVVQVLETHKLMPEHLELELTEGVVLHGLEHVSVTLERLQRLGVSVAIDDFGTGYSSLAYLRDLPINTVKIDRSFIRDLGSPLKGPQFALALVEAIVSLAAHLDLEVVAEGIEHSNQCDLLKRLGCHVGQGYYFAKPMTASDLQNALPMRSSVSAAAGLMN